MWNSENKKRLCYAQAQLMHLFTVTHPRLWDHCQRANRKTLRARRTASLLWDCHRGLSERLPLSSGCLKKPKECHTNGRAIQRGNLKGLPPHKQTPQTTMVLRTLEITWDIHEITNPWTFMRSCSSMEQEATCPRYNSAPELLGLF